MSTPSAPINRFKSFREFYPFFFEHNRPATFTYPFYSLLGDWVMFKDVLTRKIPF